MARETHIWPGARRLRMLCLIAATVVPAALTATGCGFTARDTYYAKRSLSVRPAADVSPTPVDRFARTQTP